MIGGSISAIWPVLLADGSYVVVAGEVEDGVDGALLRFSEPGEPHYAEQLVQVADVLGRRVWVSHPARMRRVTEVWVAWLHGMLESITVDPVADAGNPPPS